MLQLCSALLHIIVAILRRIAMAVRIALDAHTIATHVALAPAIPLATATIDALGRARFHQREAEHSLTVAVAVRSAIPAHAIYAVVREAVVVARARMQIP